MDVSQTLARFVAESQPGDIAEPAQDEAVRALVDWLACCLAGCLDPALDATRAEPNLVFEATQATLPGRGRRGDLASTALNSAIASDALSFAAEHAPTGARISVPVAAALVPLAESRAASGAALVHAFVIGAELTCRLARVLASPGRPLTPHANEMCGSIGAAAACAKLLGLDAYGVAHALDMAATPAAGAAGPPPAAGFETAAAARNGLVAALRAQRAASRSFNGTGLRSGLGSSNDDAALLDGLGEEWELSQSAYKAFPCDSALHAAIEACLGARARHRPLTRHIAGVELRVHPCVLERASAQPPGDSAQARRSLPHAAAVALIDGAAGREQFSGPRLTSARIVDMRTRVALSGDDSLPPSGARVVLRLVDGRLVEHSVRCARGHPARPLTDAELSEKFRELASEVLATDQAERLLALAWNVRSLGDVGALVRASVPDEALEPALLPGSPLLPR